MDNARKGRFSREKGRRVEQELVLHLAKLGYKAERILRQYQASGQPDVIATKNGVTFTFEMKARRESFKSIYNLYASEKEDDKSFRFVLPTKELVAMSTDFESLLLRDQSFRDLDLFPVPDKQMKVARRIAGLKVLRQSADFLVIKDNNKPKLFIRYW